jgi:hypothetical protein
VEFPWTGPIALKKLLNVSLRRFRQSLTDHGNLIEIVERPSRSWVPLLEKGKKKATLAAAANGQDPILKSALSTAAYAVRL